MRGNNLLLTKTPLREGIVKILSRAEEREEILGVTALKIIAFLKRKLPKESNIR